jgi:DNA-binding transcriptional LysR family regulator
VDTLTGIKVFRQVVESGSFVAAAERLDVSTANVSKHVMHIEKRLGVRLLNRSSRALSLTEPGRVYFERCKTILDDLEQTELELGSLNDAPRGTLRITAPSWFAGQQAFAEFLADYCRRYPEIVLDLSLEDRFVDIVAEGYDLALRVAGRVGSPVAGPEDLPAGLIARPVRSCRYLITASRTYLKQHGTPRSPDELARHRWVTTGDFNTLPLTGPGGTIEVPVRAVLRFRSLAGVVNAVAAGIGIAPLPEIYLDDPTFRDVLQPVLEDYRIRDTTIFAVYVSRKYVPLKIRSFVDHLLEYVRRKERRGKRIDSPAARSGGAQFESASG